MVSQQFLSKEAFGVIVKRQLGKRTVLVIPSSQRAGGDGDVLGARHRAREVVRQVHGGLHRLRELDHHHVTQSVPVLARNTNS